MNKKEFDLTSPDTLKLGLYLSNGQTALITSCSKDKSIKGIVTVSWINPTSNFPFLITISLGNKGEESGVIAYRYSYTLIKATGEFGVNVPSKELAEAAIKAGTTHSNEVDKFKEAGLTPLEGRRISPPMIQECFLNLECKVVGELETGDHTVFVGEPVTILYDEDVFVDGRFQEKYTNKGNQLHFIDLLPDMV